MSEIRLSELRGQTMIMMPDGREIPVMLPWLDVLVRHYGQQIDVGFQRNPNVAREAVMLNRGDAEKLKRLLEQALR